MASLKTFASQGDNDPVDVVEIGKQTLSTGGVYKVLNLSAPSTLTWKHHVQARAAAIACAASAAGEHFIISYTNYFMN